MLRSAIAGALNACPVCASAANLELSSVVNAPMCIIQAVQY